MIEQADQILVVDDERIAECGTHEELLRQNEAETWPVPKYASICDTMWASGQLLSAIFF